MSISMTALQSRLAWAVAAGVLVAIAGLLTFHDSPRVFGQDGTSSDATLSGLTLSGIDLGTFDSEDPPAHGTGCQQCHTDDRNAYA